MPFYQFKQHVEPLLWRQACVEVIVGAICVFETAKYLTDWIHAANTSM
ncbi:MAG TPA: hypothetical protein VF846_12235 [Thermoanaerobaculia bacterium]